MSDAAIMMVIGVVTLIVSSGISLFVSGARWGILTTDVANIKRDLAEIRELFKLQLIPSDEKDDD